MATASPAATAPAPMSPISKAAAHTSSRHAYRASVASNASTVGDDDSDLFFDAREDAATLSVSSSSASPTTRGNGRDGSDSDTDYEGDDDHMPSSHTVFRRSQNALTLTTPTRGSHGDKDARHTSIGLVESPPNAAAPRHDGSHSLTFASASPAATRILASPDAVVSTPLTAVPPRSPSSDTPWPPRPDVPGTDTGDNDSSENDVTVMMATSVPTHKLAHSHHTHHTHQTKLHINTTNSPSQARPLGLISPRRPLPPTPQQLGLGPPITSPPPMPPPHAYTLPAAAIPTHQLTTAHPNASSTSVPLAHAHMPRPSLTPRRNSDAGSAWSSATTGPPSIASSSASTTAWSFTPGGPGSSATTSPDTLAHAPIPPPPPSRIPTSDSLGSASITSYASSSTTSVHKPALHDPSDARSTRSGKSFFSRLRHKASKDSSLLGGGGHGAAAVHHPQGLPSVLSGDALPPPSSPLRGSGGDSELGESGAGSSSTAEMGSPISVVKKVGAGQRELPREWWSRIKTRSKNISHRRFARMSHVQTLTPPPPPPAPAPSSTAPSPPPAPPSPIWTVRWSPCGRFLATGGKDGLVRIWTLIGLDGARGDEPATPPPPAADAGTPGWSPKFLVDQPWLEFAGHQGDVLDLAWNRAGCVASASTDKSVRVWHLRRALSSAVAPHGGGAANEMLPLAVFQHGDFVPSVAFHPTDDWVFVTGCFDGKVRVWSLDEKRLVASVDMSPSYITAVQFVRDGQWVAAGTYAGTLAVYRLEEVAAGGGAGGGAGGVTMTLRNQVAIRSKQTRASGAAAATAAGSTRPRKITGIEPWPDPAGARDILVVASNDSRVRIVDAVDLRVIAKLKGHTNKHAQIRAHTTEDVPRWVLSGSEDGCVYVWDTVGVGELAAPPMETSLTRAESSGGASQELAGRGDGGTNEEGGGKRPRPHSRFGRLKHALFSSSTSNTNTAATTDESSPSVQQSITATAKQAPTPSASSGPPRTVSRSSITATISAYEYCQASSPLSPTSAPASKSSTPITCIGVAPQKTRLILEAANLIPSVDVIQAVRASSPVQDPESAADWMIVASADQAGAVHILVNLPAALAPAPPLVESVAGLGQLVRSMSNLAESLKRAGSATPPQSQSRSGSKSNLAEIAASGGGDGGGGGGLGPRKPAGHVSANRSASRSNLATGSMATATSASSASGSTVALSHASGSTILARAAGNQGDGSLLAEGGGVAECPYCGGNKFRDLQVVAQPPLPQEQHALADSGSGSLSGMGGAGAAGATRIIVCCQCMRVVRDVGQLLVT